MARWNTSARKRIGKGASRFVAGKDRNHDEVAKYAELMGWLVLDVHKLTGFCDFLLIRAGEHVFVEVKNPEAGGKLTPEQEEFKMLIEASGGHYEVVEHPAEDMERISREY